jgi:tetratricopeptide (TPR) repeat protein
MAHLIAALVLLVLTGAFASSALGQTDDELREMYFRRDFARMEEIAETGDTRAEAWMGLIRQQARRRDEAKMWWRRAAEKGNRWAIGSLASMHRADKEYDEALYWYRRGAELGHRNSQIVLAWMLLRGEGVAKDEREAFRLYSLANTRPADPIIMRLAEMHADGRGTERNPIEAYALAEVAEATLDNLSDGDRVQNARALKARLANELQPDEIAQAVRRAHEIRPDLAAVKARSNTVGLVFAAIASAILIFLLGCSCAAICDLVGVIRSARSHSSGSPGQAGRRRR